MKKFIFSAFERAKERLSRFLGEKETYLPTQGTEEQRIKETIEQAVFEQAAVHVIYQQKSFTGIIRTYDSENGRLILHNFAHTMTAIIQIKDIKRIRLVPESIKRSQTSRH